MMPKDKENVDNKGTKVDQLSEDNTNDLGSYRSRQSFGKAIKKVKQALLGSPSKQTAIIKKLVKDSKIIVEGDTERKTLIKGRNEEVEISIKAFYERDDISRQAPGKRDYIICRNTQGEKTYSEKAYVNDNQ